LLPTIIYHSVLEWGFIFQRPQQLLRELGKLGYRVVFIEPRQARQLAGRRQTGTVEAAPNVFVCRNSGQASRLTGEKPILWTAYPPFAGQLPKCRPGLVVYDALDLPAGEFAAWAPYVPRLRKLADIIFAVSPELQRQNARHHGNVNLLPNGVDYDHFARAAGNDLPVPPDLPGGGQPLVGFSGTLAEWLNWGLVKQIARLLPKYSFVFIGPPLLGKDSEALPRRQNIHYLGHRDYAVLPAYFAQFAALILPFKLNAVTQASDPVKLYEYLASGKPVVATPLPATGRFPDVLTAVTPAEFARQLRRAVEQDDPAARERRMQSVAGHTWAARAAAAHAVLDAARVKKE